MAEMEMYDKGTLDRVFFNRPEILAELRENRIVEPYEESQDWNMRVIPGDRRDIMALPAACVSGSVNEPYYLDLGTDGEYGAIYVGATLFRSLCNLVGYAPVQQLREAVKKVEELEKDNASLRNLLASIRINRDELVTIVDSRDDAIGATSGRQRASKS